MQMRNPHRLGLGLLTSLLLATFAAAQKPSVPGAKSGFVKTADGVRIHYLAAGKQTNHKLGRNVWDEGRPNEKLPISVYRQAILFVPGWTMPAEIWEKQIAHFSKTHRVVAMDPRSQGRSDKPAEGNYPAARARDIKAVVDQLQLAPVVLVGWSMGVVELVSYVDQFGTADLAALVLVDGIAGGDFDPKISPAMLNLAGRFQRDRVKMADSFVRSMYKNPAVLADNAYIERVKRAHLQTLTNSAVALFVGAFTTDLRATLPKIDKPVLLTTAPGSLFDPAYEDMAKRIPICRHVKFDGAGHALFVDQPENFNSLLGEFLRSFSAK
jgi:microsomal epoxide hydrolase